jgi:hypothetical protein
MQVLASQNFLYEWFGIHGNREVWNQTLGTRELIKTPEQLQDYFNTCTKSLLPCYMSVQAYKSRDVIYGLDKLFFDFDCKDDPQKAWKDIQKFTRTLENYYRIKPLTVFSGKKGYHLYVWLWNTVQFHNIKEQTIKSIYKGLQDKLLKGLSFETIDPAPLGDIKRLARVPYSIHEKSGKPCLPVNLDYKPQLISSLFEYRRYALGPYFLEKVCKEVKTKSKIKIPKFTNFKGSLKVRPCIKAAIQTNMEGGLGHSIRLAVACEYLANGNSIDKTANLFSKQPDFGNGHKSRYFVRDAHKKGYKPFKCSTISNLGFCLRKNCEIWKRFTKKI